MTGVSVGLLAGVSVAGARMALGAGLDALRERRWEREWAEVGPVWSGHLRGGSGGSGGR
jgi:hypothetical protein